MKLRNIPALWVPQPTSSSQHTPHIGPLPPFQRVLAARTTESLRLEKIMESTQPSSPPTGPVKGCGIWGAAPHGLQWDKPKVTPRPWCLPQRASSWGPCSVGSSAPVPWRW